ncbi:hypothetical protein [[Eubacterium] hominis]|uniref:hypothetical protein n=1 Tax=[Eubacterium] hominis TaxID=2764325 RepID=UPI0022E888BA
MTVETIIMDVIVSLLIPAIMMSIIWIPSFIKLNKMERKWKKDLEEIENLWENKK